jgi:hypothetical protein
MTWLLQQIDNMGKWAVVKKSRHYRIKKKDLRNIKLQSNVWTLDPDWY